VSMNLISEVMNALRFAAVETMSLYAVRVVELTSLNDH
jgi:hypothetical protein